MKYVKDERKQKTIEDYPGVEERFFEGLRLSEQKESGHNNSAIEAKTALDYIENLKKLERK